MNDKIKELLKNAEQSDAIAKNKWRIENREQLRKERKEKLKELIEKDKQQTAVEWLEERLILSFGDELKPLIGFFIISKEMEKEQIRKAYCDGEYYKDTKLTTDYYQQTYGKNHIGDVNKMEGGNQ
jgi:hypothetical protein